MLCLHGLGLSAESFRPQINALSNEFNVTAWNMPALGREEPEQMNFENLAKSGFELLDHLGDEKCHLVGHSMGGMIAIEMALQNPARISSLTLLGATSAFGGRNDDFKIAFKKERLEPLANGLSMLEVAKLNVPMMFSKNANQNKIKNSISEMAKTNIEDYKNALECLISFNRREAISKIYQPCCLIAGSLDQASPSKTMEKMSKLIRNSEYYLIQNCGHMIQLDKPKKTNFLLKNFIKRITNE